MCTSRAASQRLHSRVTSCTCTQPSGQCSRFAAPISRKVSSEPDGQLRDLGTRRDQQKIKKPLLQYTNKAAETGQTVELAEKAWRHIVVGPDDYERARDQAFDQHAKGTLFDDDGCEPEPDGDAVDDFDPLGDELSDGEEDDTEKTTRQRTRRTHSTT